MKRIAFLILLLVSQLSMAEEQAQQPKILLAAFNAYAGQLMNYADETMLYVNQLKKQYPELDIQTCKPLLVSYKKATNEIMKCVDKYSKKKYAKPDYLIILGESSGCDITLEIDAANFFDSKDTNVDGHLIKPRKINAGGADWHEGTLPYEKLFCQHKKVSSKLFENQIDVVVGPSDKNYFVCNLVNYELTDRLKETGIRYGFIHVPHFGCPMKKKEKPVRPVNIAERLLPMFLGFKSSDPCEMENAEFKKTHEEKLIQADDSLKTRLK